MSPLPRSFLAVLLLLAVSCSAAVASSDTDRFSKLSVQQADLQQCPPIVQLSELKENLEADTSPLIRQVFDWLFPLGPAGNSILGTFYISSVPNLILAFIPAEINGNTLNTMTAFATGGLLSDVFLHLVPHSFMGEHSDSGIKVMVVEEKRNILIGLAIFIGFAAFFIMEKTLRVLSGDEESPGHSHSHSHTHSIDAQASGSSANISQNGLRNRSSAKEEKGTVNQVTESPKQDHGPSKLSAYLNLFGDFVHNITDGLAMAASFYSSPLIGATTTLACFAHEIPHEIGDFSLLVRSGFTKRQAMQSQFLTAVGAFVGTFMGIAIHSAASGPHEEGGDLAAGVRRDAAGLLGTTVQYGDLVIPFVAGGFLYIGAVAVLPSLLQESKSAKQALREFAAMAFGVLCMLAVAWNE